MHTSQVYDITAFIAAHPGGSMMVELSAGRDSTIMYESGEPCPFSVAHQATRAARTSSELFL